MTMPTWVDRPEAMQTHVHIQMQNSKNDENGAVVPDCRLDIVPRQLSNKSPSRWCNWHMKIIDTRVVVSRSDSHGIRQNHSAITIMMTMTTLHCLKSQVSYPCDNDWWKPMPVSHSYLSRRCWWKLASEANTTRAPQLARSVPKLQSIAPYSQSFLDVLESLFHYHSWYHYLIQVQVMMIRPILGHPERHAMPWTHLPFVEHTNIPSNEVPFVTCEWKSVLLLVVRTHSSSPSTTLTHHPHALSSQLSLLEWQVPQGHERGFVMCMPFFQNGSVRMDLMIWRPPNIGLAGVGFVVPLQALHL
mmetsp:Transcript_9834/g.17909  ORF Transcript_9834/g.17909 Transcript_9834/m.17909 type:complete len:302 (+) Transcript_9834:250-1155(+)